MNTYFVAGNSGSIKIVANLKVFISGNLLDKTKTQKQNQKTHRQYNVILMMCLKVWQWYIILKENMKNEKNYHFLKENIKNEKNYLQ